MAAPQVPEIPGLAASRGEGCPSRVAGEGEPRLARCWAQALGWKVLSGRECEIAIGTDENGPVGMCFMPVTDLKTVKNRLHLDLTSSAQDRDLAWSR